MDHQNAVSHVVIGGVDGPSECCQSYGGWLRVDGPSECCQSCGGWLRVDEPSECCQSFGGWRGLVDHQNAVSHVVVGWELVVQSAARSITQEPQKERWEFYQIKLQLVETYLFNVKSHG